MELVLLTGRRQVNTRCRPAIPLVAGIISWVVALAADAATFIRVPNMADLKYQTQPGGQVWLRNLNQFDGAALGCCYHYFIDTTTTEGKAIFSLVLSAAAQSKGLWIGVPDGYAAGAVSFVGDW